MSSYIPETLRVFVAKRAYNCCEYCLLSEEDAFHRFHLDHIISVKHRGQTIQENLALACQFCNRNKGSDVGSFLFSSNQFVRFFNPRIDKWDEHFYLDNGAILSKTEIGEATVKILNFNDAELLIDRQLLIKAGTYPPKILSQ
ncbi:MAG: HNH endonuclease signature motif containing protein [Bacteroidia bacterium]